MLIFTKNSPSIEPLRKTENIALEEDFLLINPITNSNPKLIHFKARIINFMLI